MAGDLQMTIQGVQMTKCKTKVFRIDPNPENYPEPFIVGFAGSADEIIDVVDYYTHPELYDKMPRLKNTIGLVLTQSGRIFQFQTVSNWVEINTKFHAIGSGSSVALGAMHAGATPKEAVAAATKVDPFTGMGIKAVKF